MFVINKLVPVDCLDDSRWDLSLHFDSLQQLRVVKDIFDDFYSSSPWTWLSNVLASPSALPKRFSIHTLHCSSCVVFLQSSSVCVNQAPYSCNNGSHVSLIHPCSQISFSCWLILHVGSLLLRSIALIFLSTHIGFSSCSTLFPHLHVLSSSFSSLKLSTYWSISPSITLSSLLFACISFLHMLLVNFFWSIIAVHLLRHSSRISSISAWWGRRSRSNITRRSMRKLSVRQWTLRSSVVVVQFAASVIKRMTQEKEKQIVGWFFLDRDRVYIVCWLKINYTCDIRGQCPRTGRGLFCGLGRQRQTRSQQFPKTFDSVRSNKTVSEIERDVENFRSNVSSGGGLPSLTMRNTCWTSRRSDTESSKGEGCVASRTIQHISVKHGR